MMLFARIPRSRAASNSIAAGGKAAAPIPPSDRQIMTRSRRSWILREARQVRSGYGSASLRRLALSAPIGARLLAIAAASRTPIAVGRPVLIGVSASWIKVDTLKEKKDSESN